MAKLSLSYPLTKDGIPLTIFIKNLYEVMDEARITTLTSCVTLEFGHQITFTLTLPDKTGQQIAEERK